MKKPTEIRGETSSRENEIRNLWASVPSQTADEVPMGAVTPLQYAQLMKVPESTARHRLLALVRAGQVEVMMLHTKPGSFRVQKYYKPITK